MRKVIVLIFLIYAEFGFSKNHWIYFGAGGESKEEPNTQFDDSIEANLQIFQTLKKNYQITVAYNGGHVESEKMMASAFKGMDVRTGGFTKKNFEDILDDLERKLSSSPPQISKGEKLLVTINTHGSTQGSEEISHKVSLSGTLEYASLDRLKKLADLAKEKGVLLGIVDGSCYSGNTLKLANENTCVISVAEPNRVGYAHGFQFFSEEMAKGRSLEQVYLASRLRIDSPGFPMISSPAGTLVQDDFKVMFPFLSSSNQYSNLLEDFLEETSPKHDKLEEFICRRESRLLNGLKGFESLVTLLREKFKMTVPNDVLSRLRKNLQKYREAQMDYSAKFYDVHYPANKTPIKFETKDYAYTVTNFEIIKWDLERAQKKFEAELRKTTDEKGKKQLSDTLMLISQIKDYKSKIMKAPFYSDYLRALEDLKREEAVSFEAVQKINGDLAQIYDLYYKRVSKELKDQPNPCAKFVL